MNEPAGQATGELSPYRSAVLYTGVEMDEEAAPRWLVLPTSRQQNPAVVGDRPSEANEVEYHVTEVRVHEPADNEWTP